MNRSSVLTAVGGSQFRSRRSRLKLGFRAARAPWRLAELLTRRHLIALDFPSSASARPRWGHGQPLHRSIRDLLDADQGRYRREVEALAGFGRELESIQLGAAGALNPYWHNGWLPPLDAAAIYGFIRSRNPNTYLEIGSGISTRFARRSIGDGDLSTRLVSVDPRPRVEVDAICDRVVRAPLEDCDLDLFAGLGEGDVVFLDSTHRVFPNSDVTTFFMDILPGLATGVLVGVHDIYLPADYPPDVVPSHYSEQYMLAAWLLGGSERLRPLLPSYYLAAASPQTTLEPLVDFSWFAEGERPPSSFWFEIRSA